MNLPIMASQDCGCHENVLARIAQILREMTTQYESVLFTRFSLAFPSSPPYPADNSIIVVFMRYFIAQLKMHNCDPRYVWTYSKAPNSPSQTYHVALWIDARVTTSTTPIFQRACHQWALALRIPDASSLVIPDPSSGNGIILRRGDPDFNATLNRVYELASYLALANVKGHAPNGAKALGSSQIFNSMSMDQDFL